MLLYATDSEIAYFSHKEVSSDEGAFHRSEEKLITVLQLQSLAMCLLGAGGCACGLSTYIWSLARFKSQHMKSLKISSSLVLNLKQFAIFPTLSLVKAMLEKSSMAGHRRPCHNLLCTYTACKDCK